MCTLMIWLSASTGAVALCPQVACHARAAAFSPVLCSLEQKGRKFSSTSVTRAESQTYLKTYVWVQGSGFRVQGSGFRV